MPVQIDQKLLRCARCGKMLHKNAPQVEVTKLDGKRLVFCPDICLDEYAALFDLDTSPTTSRETAQ